VIVSLAVLALSLGIPAAPPPPLWAGNFALLAMNFCSSMVAMASFIYRRSPPGSADRDRLPP
jgi:hypothetical protein